MHDGAERDVSKIRRRAVITHDAVRKYCEWMRSIAKELAGRFHAKTATPIRMIHERQHASVSMCLFQRRKLPWFGPEQLVG